MKPLQSRKQLLIAESELNREQLVHEWQTMAAETRSLVQRATTISSLASAVTTMVAGLAFSGRKDSRTTVQRPSRGQTIVKVAGLIATFWSAFRAQPKP